MKRTIKEVYDLIVEKRDNAQRDLNIKRANNTADDMEKGLLRGNILAYYDVLCLIESSGLLPYVSTIDVIPKPIKGNGLEFIESELKYYKEHIGWYDDGHKISQREVDEYENVYKELKALEIINSKDVQVSYLKKCETLDDYNSIWGEKGFENRKLTQEEFDLLKEVLL